MTYDDWLTTDPNDGEVCEEHEQRIPCRLCRADAAEYRAESAREGER